MKNNKIKAFIFVATFIGVITAYLPMLNESLLNGGANAEEVFFSGIGGAGILFSIHSSIKSNTLKNSRVANKGRGANYLNSDRVSITKKGNYKFE